MTEILRALASAASAAAPILPGIGPAVASAIAAGIGLAADLFEAGADPVKEITRIRKTEPLLRKAETTWAEAIERKWPADE